MSPNELIPPKSSSELIQRYGAGERDFRRADLYRDHLSGVVMQNVDLSQARFDAAKLCGVNFSGIDLMAGTGADSVYADCHFDGASLAEADLSGASLEGVSFRNADLFGANLAKADLRGVDFTGANLRKADLRGANLSIRGEDLRATSLVEADLRDANLTEASLWHVHLKGANLTRTILARTRFSQCFFERTILCDVALQHAMDLESSSHWGPSMVDFSTLATSSGHIPKVFLQGCGMADWEIEASKLYDTSLGWEAIQEIVNDIFDGRVERPVMLHSVFISYSHHDEAFAQKLYSDLQSAGVRCWFAPHDIKPGAKIHEQIKRAIEVQDRLVLVLSTNSMASSWINTEIANARKKERTQKRSVLFPIRLVPFDHLRQWELFDADQGDDSAREIREYFIPDFSDWTDPAAYAGGLKQLIAALRKPSAVSACNHQSLTTSPDAAQQGVAPDDRSPAAPARR